MFSNKFWYFILGSFLLLLVILSINIFYLKTILNEQFFYSNFLVLGVLIIYYPTTFTIQHDLDNRMLEILFGIPNYRFKVHLLRLFIILLVTFSTLFVFSLFVNFGFIKFSIHQMLYQLLIPILFISSFSFLLATIFKDGSGTAIVLLIIGIFIWFNRGFFIENPKWDIFLNPFYLPENIKDDIWMQILEKNRLYLFIGSIITSVIAMLNLQNREKFL